MEQGLDHGAAEGGSGNAGKSEVCIGEHSTIRRSGGRRHVHAKCLIVVRSSDDDEDNKPEEPCRDKGKQWASSKESDKERQPPTQRVWRSLGFLGVGPLGSGRRVPLPGSSQPPLRVALGSEVGSVTSYRCQLEEAAIQEQCLTMRLQETYIEVQRERRAQEDMQVKRDEVGQAQEALEGEVASLRARLKQGDGRVLDPGKRAAELQKLLGRVEEAQASLVQRRSWLVGSVAAAWGEAMCKWPIVHLCRGLS